MNRKKTHRLLGILLALLLFTGVLLLPSAVAGTVTVNDPNLRSALTLAVGSSSLTTDNMANLTALDLSGKGISDLTGLEAAVNLKQLSLRGNSVTDISSLSGLTALTTLDLSENQISSVVPLFSMNSLRVLHLTGNEVSGLSEVESLQKLQFLFCEDNRLDLSPGTAASRSVETLLQRGCYVVTGTQKPALPDSSSSEPVSPDSASSAPAPSSSSPSSADSSQSPASSGSAPTEATLTAKPGSGAKIDRSAGFLSGIALNTPVSAVQTLLDGSGTIRVINASGAAASGNLGTGMTVELVDSSGSVTDKLTVVIYGDINGNGSIDVGDLVLVNQYVLEMRKLDGAFYQAANVTKKTNSVIDTVVNVGDLVVLNQIILNMRTITQ